jgi:hypothetical protein
MEVHHLLWWIIQETPVNIFWRKPESLGFPRIDNLTIDPSVITALFLYQHSSQEMLPCPSEDNNMETFSLFIYITDDGHCTQSPAGVSHYLHSTKLQVVQCTDHLPTIHDHPWACDETEKSFIHYTPSYTIQSCVSVKFSQLPALSFGTHHCC